MIDHKRRAEEIHRRAQLAEGRLERAMWWIEAGLKNGKPLGEDKPWLTNRFYLEEAKRAADRETRPHHRCTTAAVGRNTLPSRHWELSK